MKILLSTIVLLLSTSSFAKCDFLDSQMFKAEHYNVLADKGYNLTQGYGDLGIIVESTYGETELTWSFSGKGDEYYRDITYSLFVAREGNIKKGSILGPVKNSSMTTLDSEEDRDEVLEKIALKTVKKLKKCKR